MNRSPHRLRTRFAVAVTLLPLAAWLGPAAGTTSADFDTPRGDVDCDGAVDSTDALVVLQYHAGLRSVPRCVKNAYLDGDTRADSTDAMLILQFHAGLIDHLPPIRSFIGTVILARGVEADCIALQTEAELFVLWDPPQDSLGKRVKVTGFIEPFFHTVCAVGPVLHNLGFEKLD